MKDEKPAPPEDLLSRTKRFALRVIKMFNALPKTEVAKVLGRQVLRSGTSVGANYREARRSRSKAEFAAKVGDSLKETEETGYWLELLADSGEVPAQRLADLLDECNQLNAILTPIHKKSRA